MDISQIKFLANQKGIVSITGNKERVKIVFSDQADIGIKSLNSLIQNFGSKVQFNNKGEKSLIFNLGKYPLMEIKDLVENISWIFSEKGKIQ